MRIWGGTPIKGPPACIPCPLMRHQGTCSRSPDAFAPHRVLTRLKVAEKPFQRVRPAGPSLGKSPSIEPPWRLSWRRQPSCWQSPFGYYRWWAAGLVCSVHGLTHSSGQDAALPRNMLSGVGCVAFSVAVNVLFDVADCLPPPPFSTGLGTGNGGVS